MNYLYWYDERGVLWVTYTHDDGTTDTMRETAPWFADSPT